MPRYTHLMASHDRFERAESAAKGTDVPPLRVTTRELLKGRSELIIVHEGREYRLRITQNGKLILTA
jgi:hemin uptake protein HemP